MVSAALNRYLLAELEYQAAHSALVEAIPEGTVVLACRPGEARQPDTIYWSYSKDGETLLTGVSRGDTKAIIVEVER